MVAHELPLRSELFSIDLLKQHARGLAQKHRLASGRDSNPLLARLSANEELLQDFNDDTLHVEKKRRITPAAEWLLDNFYLIEEQIRMARRHLPRGFSRELPRLAAGPSVHLPRVYDLALELISHVDGRIDAEHLTAFIAGYQEVVPLQLGELWAVPIMLRLALIENLRRIAALLSRERKDRDAAEYWSDRLIHVADTEPQKQIIEVARLAQSDVDLNRAFVAQFWSRLQQKSPGLKLALNWIEERLAHDGHTIEQLVQSENQSQAANQISVGNSISSLRFLDAMDWREFVETLSCVEQTLRNDPSGVYGDMDFASRDAYRHVIERVGRHSPLSELDAARLAVDLAARYRQQGGRLAHVGYYLLDDGFAELQRESRMKEPLQTLMPRLARKFPMAFYLGGIATISTAFTFLFVRIAAAAPVTHWMLALVAMLGVVSSSQLALAFVNWLTTRVVRPRLVPRLDFSEGIPAKGRTMVVVPTLLTNPRKIESLIEALEVRYLANRDDNVYFALLTDFCDAAQESLPGDEELAQLARDGIAGLNTKYQEDRPCIFYLFHRPRRWNPQDRVWMGHERKRGKLAEFNRLLRGGPASSFSHIEGDLEALPHIQYVITLDTDTQLPRDAARQLAGAMAHPLNRPVYDSRRERVVQGYSILQPRVAVSLPSASRSRFAKLFSGDPGIDPYTRAVSDVYQDLFHEGSFIGKGIYDVDAFERAVGGRFPENRILSHDLLEGSYARSGLVTDVQLFEEFPSVYTADTRRRHRWMRGDWQIATWLLPRVPGADVRRVANPIGGLSRWKIFDNLRRSIVPMALVGLLGLGWLMIPSNAVSWSLFVVVIIALPGLLAVLTELFSKPSELPLRLHLRNVGQSTVNQLGQAFLTLVFLPYDAWMSLDAAIRTIGRLIFTRRNLLEWQTATDTEERSGTDMRSFWATMWCAPVLAALVLLGIGLLQTSTWIGALPFLVLWTLAPLAAWWISQPLGVVEPSLSTEQRKSLRRLARKTWRYFEEFTTPQENWLPPDNFQEEPRPMIASRTSPTNMAMALLGTLAAWDLGYLSVNALLDRLGATLQTMEKLERYRGHFYNWYDTRTLKPLQPLYVSTVDNGNLAALLLTLRAGLIELTHIPWPTPAALSGLRDTAAALRESVENTTETKTTRTILPQLDSIDAHLAGPADTLKDCFVRLDQTLAIVSALPVSLNDDDPDYAWWRAALEKLCRNHREDFLGAFPWIQRGPLPKAMEANHPVAMEAAALMDGLQWPASRHDLEERFMRMETLVDAARASSITGPVLAHLTEWQRALQSAATEADRRASALTDLAASCDDFARMDFSLLYDATRRLFSIGYNVTHHRLDGSYYDLLASEARLASFVAIALGQVPQEHWFTLGRLLTSVDGQRTLISWSGSMFEYLMPSLVMPTYEDTLLQVSCRAAVSRQIEYGRQRRVPWGISESGYFLTDAESNYQYRAFGVPGLGFKRGLAEDLVIAPYATTMALGIDPQAAFANLARLRAEKVEGRYGFYEAVDFTPSRMARGQTRAILQSFMAHHQGMSLLALADVLLDGPMQRRFQANPFFRAAELLLQERLPRETTVFYPHELEAGRTRVSAAEIEATFRVFTNPGLGPPEVHLLSNGRYHVMVTSAGGGYSLWNETALTRWREDSVRDCWGLFIYLRDRDRGAVWSVAHQPVLAPVSNYEAIFSQGRAEFRSRHVGIDLHTEISVSPEDDVEVRRVALTNHTSELRTIELTSFAEVVLNSPAADQSHPAFSKLFIQTEIVPGRQAIVCSRRPRGRDEQPPWMFHLMLVEGDEAEEISFESDRLRFLGRGRTAVAPAAMDRGAPLSNRDGPVLDPAVAIRRTLRIPPKQSARVTLVAGSAGNREALMRLVEKYQDQSIAGRVFDLAWTHGTVTLRHLNATEQQAQLFGRLAGALLYPQVLRRSNAATLAHNRRGQRNLWSLGISGDLPILLVRSTSLDRLQLVREVLQAHAYWRLKGLSVDLVILNEDDSVYRQSIHDQIMALIASGIEAPLLDKPGGIFVRRSEQLSHEDQILLQAAAHVLLSDDNGTLAEQVQRRARPDQLPPALRPPRMRSVPHVPSATPSPRQLIFANGLGGFTPDGREYIISLNPGQTTPAPWVNVIANSSFGTVISESGSAYTWSENCHEFRLTPWVNDPVSDGSGEAFYIRDEHSGRFWSPTPLPVRQRCPSVTRHGLGYSVFEAEDDGLYSELWIYVATDAPVKFCRLVLRNGSDVERRLSIFGYWEWVLGDLRQRNQMHVITELDGRTGALLARNAYNTDFGSRIAFVSASDVIRSHTGDRAEFIGRHGSLALPAALSRVRLSGKVGPGYDPCAAVQVPVTLAPREEHEIIFKIGAGQNRDEVYRLLHAFQGKEACRNALARVHAHWNDVVGAVQVHTPDPALNVLTNAWLPYQILSCRYWARTGFYQSGGAFGFRDQLQDTMAMVHCRPSLLREHILRAAAHQFREGDVQHWWHPPTDRGVRTHFSDDYLWLPYAVCRYVGAIGDTGVLDENVAFLDGRPVRPEEEAYYDTPRYSGEVGTVYEHCVRSIRNALKFGRQGLPLIGCGDWNDGMNRVGERGEGQSVWLGFFLYDVLNQFAGLARSRGDEAFARECTEQAIRLRENIEIHAWDGGWYRRAYFDNGEPLGSVSNPECQIDALPQSWAILSGVSDPKRARAAMDAVAHRLVRQEARIIQLLDPPFDKSALDPGYIKGYLPGVRENGGQYTHAAVWTVMAFAMLGDVRRAWQFFDLINPVRHADSAAGVARYFVEPYVVAADVYSVAPHTGRGGWTWYTGSAGWMYRLMTETLLGLKLQVDRLYFFPRLPDEWTSFQVHYRFREAHYHITLRRVGDNWHGPQKIHLDGAELPESYLPLQGENREHHVEVQFI